MKILMLFVASILMAQTVPVAGTWKNPDGTAFTGTATVQFTRPTVLNSCLTLVQVVPFKMLTIRIAAGVMPSTSLYASDCLSTGNSSPSIFLGFGGAGMGAVVSGTGNWYGTVSVTAGSAPAASATIVRIALRIPPLLTCYVLPTNSAALAYSATLVSQRGSGSISQYLSIVAGSTALVPATVYTWSFHCVQPYQVSVYTSDNYLLYNAKWIVPISGSPVDVTAVDLTQIGALP